MNIRVFFITTLISFFGLTTQVISNNTPTLLDTSVVIINKIIITGNNTTKEKIIQRELLFIEGDTIPKTDLENILTKSKENLFNSSLFNFITIKTIENDPFHSSIFIMVEERWYLWPYPILEQADRNLSAFFHNNDWSRINYGLMLTKFNFRGRKETLKFKARFGYKEQFQIYYNVPYLTPNKKNGLSFEFSWYRQHETSVYTQNDQLVYYHDTNHYAKKYHTTYLAYQYRPKHYATHQVMLGYTYLSVSDTIASLNPNYIGDAKSNTEFFSFSYNFNINKCDYKLYPLTGYSLNAGFEQFGFGILKDEIDGIQTFKTSANKYFNIKGRWYTGLGGSLKLSSNSNQPFFIQEALGYGESLRAYEYNVIDGQQYTTGRTFLKFAIIPLNVRQIQSWGWKRFNKIHYSLYVNAFFDAGYVHNKYNDPSNILPNTMLYSGGLGIDLVAYYDLILRCEYSINRNKESGFFFHIGKAF